MIAKILTAGLVVLTTPLLALLALAAIAGGATSSAQAGASQAVFNPSEEAINDIPPLLLELFITHATTCPGLPWQVLAGIMKVESNHGRYRGASIGPDGRATPEIIGIALDGTNGTGTIDDTDNGQFDHDLIWDRAVGPGQFIPSSWALFGRDGNGDSIKDPHNVYDVVPAMVAHLCPAGTVIDIEAAVFGYNHSSDYVTIVLDWAIRYTGPIAFAGNVVGEYAYPLPSQYATEQIATRSHHDYPAIDIGAPVGTPVYAIAAGQITTAIGNAGIYNPDNGGRCGNTIVIRGIDSATYTYCHLSAVLAERGQTVAAGDNIGLTGGQPGDPGAGNTTGPHLHLGIRVYGRSICPQPILLGIIQQTPIPPTAAPDTGCYFPGPTTDWSPWLTSVYLPLFGGLDDPTAMPPAGAQWTMVRTQTVTQTASSYMDLTFSQPPIGGWSAWANTELTLAYNVTSKPTNAPIQVQICAWRHRILKFQEETCSSAALLTITTTGQYQVNVGRPRDWWAKGGRFPWGTTPSIIRLMHKVDKRLPMTSRCGAYCTIGDVSRYVPITGSVQLVLANQ